MHRDLIRQPDAQLLAGQTAEWQCILDLSAALAVNTAAKAWPEVLTLAESRDKRISLFFQQDICQALFIKVMKDFDDIKQQHSQLMAQLDQASIENEQSRNQIETSREHLNQLLGSGL
ncbi:MAG: hypothetical protein KUG79_07785 [Pseudomonadales bacterium]|nr:hypothetical protein [Pseudomonadales bacterium]